MVCPSKRFVLRLRVPTPDSHFKPLGRDRASGRNRGHRPGKLPRPDLSMAATGLSVPTSSGVPEANQVVASIAAVPDDPSAPLDFDTLLSPHEDEYPEADGFGLGQAF
jgi:hypothetical protein